MPSLLKDPATEILFMQGTPSRAGIISELARHLTKDTSEADAPRRQFEKADFLIPNELANDIKEAGPIAGRYLEKLQRTTSTKQLEEAVELLNGIVDDAIAPLATPADTSLSELFYEVRRQLLADGLELILLVEDFAVLAGVQRAMLDAIRREGQVGGKAEACTIRTALAVTEGYFFDANLDTVLSRAVHGWWIESGEDEAEDDVTNQIGNFVAAYINAARIGAKQLEKHYKDSATVGKKAPNAMEYLAPETDEIGLLANFGQSADEYSLFPFNQSAICTIANWKLRDQQGRLKFHPRSVINEVILPVVKDSRIHFERGEFPPNEFLGFRAASISTDLTEDIKKKESNLVRREKYRYLLHFWAGHPRKLSEAKLPAGVYEAFGLSILDGSETSVEPERLKPLPSSDGEIDLQSRKAESVIEQEPKHIRQFVEALEIWKGGEVLGQENATKIRQLINMHLMYSINWEAELLRPLKPTTNTFATSIYLPRSKGNPPNIDKAFIIVATDEQFEDDAIAGPIFLALRAMFRYDYYKGWNYDQYDEDYIAISNFIDRHLASSTAWIRSNYKHVDGSPLPSLTQALLWQARQLNVETAHKVDDASQINAVFAEAPERGQIDEDQDWNEFIADLATHRTLLRDELLERTAAVQGDTGKKAYAVDASQLLDVVQSFRKSWEVTDKFPQMPPSVSDELKRINKHINLLSRYGNAKIEGRRKRISDQSKLIVAELGKEYDKNELLKDLEEVCSLSEQFGLKGETSVGQVRKLTERIRNAPAKTVGEQVEAIVSVDDLGTCMTAIARLDIQTHELLVEFANTCSEFLKERAGKAQNQILHWKPEVVEMTKADVVGILQELEEAVAPYQKEDT